MTTISAKTILRSTHALYGNTVSTLILRYPRWIHAENRTHRTMLIGEDWEINIPTPSFMADPNLSRNASSSRAIPINKLLEDVLNDPAIPVFWGKNQKGMQSYEMLPDHLAKKAEILWLEALYKVAGVVRGLADLEDGIGVHKQTANRLLEPWSHINVVATATEWDNFLHLREHEAAEPHIHLLATAIKAALKDPSQLLQVGDWHRPFITKDDEAEAAQKFGPQASTTLLEKCSACCASVSYKTVEGFDMTFENAKRIHDSLKNMNPMHASPFEHPAMASKLQNKPFEQGNLRNFLQYRKLLEEVSA